MKPRFPLLLNTGLLAFMWGCSGGDPSNASGDASGAAGAKRPLDGKAPTKSSQLEGRWVRVGPAEFDSMEFMKDGKALVGGEDAGLTLDYAVLEGGRLSLSASGGGMTTVYEAIISGDQIELKSKGNVISEAGTHRYRRLLKDETVHGVLEAEKKAKADAYRKRIAELEAFLKQPGLVLTFRETGPGAPASIALDIQQGGGGFTGKAWHDDKPPHLNLISGALQLNQPANTAQLTITYGQRIAPPTARPDGGGTITMNVQGNGKDLSISARVTYGGGGPEHEMTLRSDAKVHAEIVKRFEVELARIEALKQPIIALLKDYASLHGRLAPMDQRSTVPDTVDLTMLRDAKSGQYFCEGAWIGARGRGEVVTKAAAEIVIADDRPMLRIVCPPTREFLLALPDAKAPRFAGKWMTPGSDQGKGAEFEVIEALDAGERDKEFDRRRTSIKELGADSVFTGLAFEDSGFGMEMPIPCKLQLSVRPDGTVAGKADYPTMSTRMAVTGQIAETPVGPCLQLRHAAAESTPGDKIFLRSIQSGMWSLIPAPGGGEMKLTGFFSGPPLRPVMLTLVDDRSLAQLRGKLVDALSVARRFCLVKFVGWQVPGQAPTVVEWKLDEATNKITGRLLTEGRPLGTSDKVVPIYEGEVKQDDGWIQLELVQISAFHSYDRNLQALKLMVVEDRGGVLHLNGATCNMGTVPLNGPRPPFPANLDRLIEFISIDAIDAETRAAADKAIAAVVQAKAEADARLEAQQAAALEARRAKMAPFFPLFKAKTGLVITTDAPAELGAVIIESLVDEDKATMTGKGVDLREMPFRDFTFETGIDNRGNLTVTTSGSKTPYTFAPPKDNVAAGRGMTLTGLTDADRAKLESMIALGKRLQVAEAKALAVQVLDPAAAKAREAGLAAIGMPGIAIYKNRVNDQIAALFTAQSNGRYRWVKEPLTMRLNLPMKGKALYIKGGGPTDNLVVIINGAHRATIPAIAQLGAAIVTLPPDLELLDLRFMAEGTAQARGIVLLK